MQFAVCSLHGLLGTERFTLPCNWHRGGYTHMDSIQRTQVNRTTQRANDASLFCLLNDIKEAACEIANDVAHCSWWDISSKRDNNVTVDLVSILNSFTLSK